MEAFGFCQRDSVSNDRQKRPIILNSDPKTMPNLLLASSSPYRRELLSRLRLPFTHHSPEVDESPKPSETPEELARRLARSKALALAPQYPNHLIIGSDQVAACGDHIFGKPGDFIQARAQLRMASGNCFEFLTGLALLNTATGQLQVDCIRFEVHFRVLSEPQIERYLRAETPYDCAGSFKAEGLGISLFRAMRGDDPTSLIGLPLIRLVDMLQVEGVAIP